MLSGETAAELFLDELLKLFGCAEKYGAGLLDGTLSLRYCAVAFERKIFTWKLSVLGNVALLFCDAVENVGLEVYLKCQEYIVIGLKVMGRREEREADRFRLTRKTNPFW